MSRSLSLVQRAARSEHTKFPSLLWLSWSSSLTLMYWFLNETSKLAALLWRWRKKKIRSTKSASLLFRNHSLPTSYTQLESSFMFQSKKSIWLLQKSGLNLARLVQLLASCRRWKNFGKLLFSSKKLENKIFPLFLLVNYIHVCHLPLSICLPLDFEFLWIQIEDNKQRHGELHFVETSLSSKTRMLDGGRRLEIWME